MSNCSPETIGCSLLDSSPEILFTHHPQMWDSSLPQ